MDLFKLSLTSWWVKIAAILVLEKVVPSQMRKSNISLNAPPMLVCMKIHHLKDVSKQIQQSALPCAVLASRHTPLYCIFHTHKHRCFAYNKEFIMSSCYNLFFISHGYVSTFTPLLRLTWPDTLVFFWSRFSMAWSVHTVSENELGWAKTFYRAKREKGITAHSHYTFHYCLLTAQLILI